MPRPDEPLPTGVVTFLLTDIEGSTQAWQAAPDRMPELVSTHYEILDRAIAAHGGVRPQEQGEGDSVVAAFADPVAALTAAVEAQVELRSTVPELPVRMALHTGDATLRGEENYVGLTIIRCARIRSCGHGGQILMSAAAAEFVPDTGPFDLLDLGSYGLKGLDGRQRIWQLLDPRLPSDFPPLNAGSSAAGNLPVSISSFVGRRSELAALAEMLSSHRLVTLVGDAGIGKTRLAMAAAAAAADSMPGGVWWIPLSDAPGDDVDAVVAWMLHSCALPRPAADPLGALIEYFGSIARSVLLVDGVERAPDAVASVVSAVLAHCADVQVITTGVDPLRVSGECVFAVPSMSLPSSADVDSIDSLVGFDATRLFIERAAAASGRRFDDDDASHIREVCSKLRGAPQPIELAAARVRSTSISELATSVSTLVAPDGPADLAATLASSIRWSYQLLDSQAQRALAALGIFQGDIEIDAAASVLAGAGLDETAAATALRRLFEQQLVTFDDVSVRVRISPSVRSFARELLSSASFAAAVSDRHGGWFASIAERFSDVAGGDGTLPLSLLVADEADVLAALDASMRSEQVSVAYRIAVALGDRWEVIGRPEVGEAVATWLSARSPSDGEEMWAAAVARSCLDRSSDPDSPIHQFADEAVAIAELVRDEASPELIARARARTARTVDADMAPTT